MRKLTLLFTWVTIAFMALGVSLYFNYQVSEAKVLHRLLRSDEKVLSMAPTRTLSFAALPKESETNSATISKVDARALVIESFLEKYKSPLADYAEFIVETADRYGLPDFRIIPAIAMQESNGCRKLPEVGGTYNCWGYGIYGKVSLGFDGYEVAIDRVARGLKTDYYDKGLTTPYQIMTKYTPPSLAKGGPWAKGVEYFMEEMH